MKRMEMGKVQGIPVSGAIDCDGREIIVCRHVGQYLRSKGLGI